MSEGKGGKEHIDLTTMCHVRARGGQIGCRNENVSIGGRDTEKKNLVTRGKFYEERISEEERRRSLLTPCFGISRWEGIEGVKEGEE